MDLLCHELLKAQKTQHICAGHAKKMGMDALHTPQGRNHKMPSRDKATV
jgi:hypothetical protein